MNKKQFLISLVFVSIFSFFGGIIGGVISSDGDILATDKTLVQNPKKIDYIESESISVKRIIANHLWIENDEGKEIVRLSSRNGNPYFNFYSKQNPLDENKGPTFVIWIGKDGAPKMQFYDKYLNQRVQYGVQAPHPTMRKPFKDRYKPLIKKGR